MNKNAQLGKIFKIVSLKRQINWSDAAELLSWRFGVVEQVRVLNLFTN